MADRAKLPWIVATVLTPKHEAMPAPTRAGVQDALRLAETLGAEAVTLRVAETPPASCCATPRSRNVTRLVVGRPRWRGALRQRLMALIREPVSERLLDGATDFEVTIVTPQARAERRRIEARTPPLTGLWRDGAAALAATAGATLLAWPVAIYDAIPAGGRHRHLPAGRHGHRRALRAGRLACGERDLASSPITSSTPIRTIYAVRCRLPRTSSRSRSFSSARSFTGTLASRLKAQIEAMRASQARTQTLYEFAARSPPPLNPTTCSGRGRAHRQDAQRPCPDPDARRDRALQQVQGWPAIERISIRAPKARALAFDKAEAQALEPEHCRTASGCSCPWRRPASPSASSG